MTFKDPMRRWAKTIAAGSLLFIAACTQPPTSDITEPTIADPPPRLSKVTQINLPLTPYNVTPQEAATVYKAEQLLAVACASSFGVSFAPDLTVTALPSGFDASARYGPLDREWAAEHGYTPQDDTYYDGGSPWDPTPLELEVITGLDANGAPSTLTDSAGNPIPEGGCLEEATRDLFHDRPYMAELVRLLEDGMNHALDRVSADSRVLAAQQAWADCMKTKGYDVSDTWTVGDLAVNPDGSPNTAVAVTDVDCSQNVNLPGTMYAVDAAYQERWLVEHGAELKTLHDGYLAGLKRAQEVLANR